MAISINDFKEGGCLRRFVTKVGLLDKIDTDFNQEDLLQLLLDQVSNVGTFIDSNPDGRVTKDDDINPDLEGDTPTPAATEEDLDNAIAEGGKVVLEDDIQLTNSLNVANGVEVEIDLGGKTLSASSKPVVNVNGGTVTLKNGKIETTGTKKADPVQVVNGGTLILDGAEITSAKNNGISAEGEGSKVIINSGNVTAQEAGIYPSNGAELTINGGTISCIDNGGVMGNGTSGKGNTTIIMNGGRIEGHIVSSGYQACAVYLPNSGTFTMNGGEIVSDGCGICMRGGTANLNGGSITCSENPAVNEGKVGDSRVVVGPYAVVYDANSKYPACDTLQLNIAEGMEMWDSKGSANNHPYIQVILQDGQEENINDLRPINEQSEEPTPDPEEPEVEQPENQQPEQPENN